ncbi:MAG: bifunctional 4-hydroxy-2-oxoglutarate aldolase/2-dehydro-3-deoxy-phosphogluconate aldolase [Hyphomicrobiales bacterium]|nr:bifunctional 4-hydroxy-2-oxoglutarate aldolase/2-dehydro-3-deoxy-phosphogluconate aldolase [Hyphomicrobiales bacterium]
MEKRESDLQRILTAAPVVPVLTIESTDVAVPLARALVAGGLKAIEVTLRTAAALDCIRAIAAEVEDCDVGAGTVLDEIQFAHAVDAGARFIVSPGASAHLVETATDAPTPFLPGVATVGEAMSLAEKGFSTLKFFPAEAAGGVAYLKALAAPLASIRFCPTGGVTPANAADYLSLPNVICVGGSWVAPSDAVSNGNWTRIIALSREALTIGQDQGG